MLRRTHALLAAGMLAAAIAPAAHAEDTWAGFTCGFTSTNDPTGQVIQDPNTQTGEIDGGPWAVANTTGGSVASVTITCTIKVNDGANNGVGGTSRNSVTSGNVGVLVDTITYTALPGDDVYLCTSVAWSSSKGGGSVLVDDDDDATNGIQCSLATSVEA